MIENQKKEIEEQRNKREELLKKLNDQEQIIEDQNQKIQSMIAELEVKNVSIGESSPQSARPYEVEDEIGEILREARKEGQSILDNARIEAEQEMIKLLKLRMRFKQEEEEYKEWCRQAEAEQESVNQFLKQLSTQYAEINHAIHDVKAKADSFVINDISKVESDNKDDTEE